MRCREAKFWLAAQRDGDLAESDQLALQEHLKHCPGCQTYEQRQQCLDMLLTTSQPAVRTYSSISTERIMQAVRQQQRITQQLETIRTQQQSRIARMGIVGPSLIALFSFTIGSIPLLLLAFSIAEPDMSASVLSALSDVVAVIFVFVQYLQSALALVAHDNRLLSGVALALVIMMGLWLRLMRYPQEA